MRHPLDHEPDWNMTGLKCSQEGCLNEAKHDWAVAALCCAHDEIHNLEMANDMLNEKIIELERWVL